MLLICLGLSRQLPTARMDFEAFWTGSVRPGCLLCCFVRTRSELHLNPGSQKAQSTFIRKAMEGLGMAGRHEQKTQHKDTGRALSEYGWRDRLDSVPRSWK